MVHDFIGNKNSLKAKVPPFFVVVCLSLQCKNIDDPSPRDPREFIGSFPLTVFQKGLLVHGLD